MQKESNFKFANAIKYEKTCFNRAIAYSYLLEAPRTKMELTKLMDVVEYTVTEYCNWLELNGFIIADYQKIKNRANKIYTATDKKDYPWPARYLKAKDPRKDYFDLIYANIHKELRDAIYEGRISRDIIRTHKEISSPHWEFKKLNKTLDRGYLTSSMAGEYIA